MIFLIIFLATRELVAPLANDPIMSGRLIQSFRHLELQKPSIISDSIDRARYGNNSGGTEETEEEHSSISWYLMDILQNLVVQCLLSQHGNVKMQSFSPPCPNIAMSQSSNLLSCVGTWQCHNPVCIPDVPCPNTTISQSNDPSVSAHIFPTFLYGDLFHPWPLSVNILILEPNLD